ncbi:myosin heavy chain, clone 203 [Diachasma alloeum]|uniref:myosin heavy chain, clone 203 n=1 Tax=Diachasma alloeum TaxID=454923 RepID=UPI00073813C7|nr:myosin heavy chain, clone 203 [Diachasma alloeum]
MDISGIIHPQSSSSPLSPGDDEPPRKRQKLDILSPSSLNNSNIDSVLNTETEYEHLKTKFMTLRVRLSKSEATITQLHRIRSEIEDLLEKEKTMQQWQAKVETEMIDQLQVALNEAMRKTDEALEAKRSAEAKFSEIKTRMEEEMSALLIENTRLKNEIPSNSEVSAKSQEDTESLEKLKIAEKRILELEEKLEDNMISQMEFYLLNVELKQATDQRLKSEETAGLEKKQLLTRVQELGDELQSSKNIISTLVEEIELLKQKQLEIPVGVEEQVAMQQENEELYSKSPEYDSERSGNQSPTGTNVMSPQETYVYAIQEPQQLTYAFVFAADTLTSIYELEQNSEELEDTREDVNKWGSNLESTHNESTCSYDDLCNILGRDYPSTGSERGEVEDHEEIVGQEAATKSLEMMVGDHSIRMRNPSELIG